MKFFLIKIFQLLYCTLINRNIKISLKSKVSPYFLINLSKKKKDLVIGGAEIGKKIQVEDGVKFFGSMTCSGKIKIGKYSSINGPGTRVIGDISGVQIGSFCSIAPGVIIQEVYHKYNRPTSYYVFKHIFKEGNEKDVYSKGKIIIEDDVWVGSNSVILSGITIGRGSIIGAGSIVTKNIPPYSIVGGNPAKVIKKRFSEETIKMLEECQWWNWDIEKIKKNREFFMKELY